MQLLYGNDGVNYHTIAKSKEITVVQEKELLQGYLGYSFVENLQDYSSVDKEPVALSYVTTDLVKTLPKEMIVLSRNAKMSNYLTPSYYSHFHLMEAEDNMYEENFFNLLQYSFIKDVDLKQYLTTDIDSFIQEKETGLPPLNKNAMEKEHLTVILASVLNIVDGISKQVRIILDVEGDAYNQRALDVLATLYDCIPYGIRKRAGFSTYTGIDAGNSSRIKVQLYTREAVGRLGSDCIDLANINIEEIIRKIPEEIFHFAKMLVEKEENRRKKMFGSFKIAFRGSDVSIMDYISFYKNYEVWLEGHFETVKDELASYAYRGMKEKEKKPVFYVFASIMSGRFSKENLYMRYQELLKELLVKQHSFEFEPKIEAYIMLGEVVENVQFLPEMFLRWEQQEIIAKAEKEYEDLKLYECLNKQLKKLQTISVGGEKFKEIILKMEEYLKERMLKLREEIEKRIKAEEQNIIAEFQQLHLPLLNMRSIEEKYSSIQYVENQNIFKKELSFGLKKAFSAIKYFENYERYEYYKQFIIECGEFLGADESNEIVDIIEEKGKRIKTMEQLRKIRWESKQDILLTYHKIFKAQTLLEELGIKAQKYHLEIYRNIYEFEREELEELILALLCYDSEKSKILSKYKRLVKDLLYIQAFGEEHFDELMFQTRNDMMLQQKILRYYLSDTILLSKEIIKNSLKRVDEYTLKKLMEDITEENILSIVLKEKNDNRYEKAEKKYDLEQKQSDFEKKKNKGKGRKEQQGSDAGIQLYLLLLIGTLLPAVAFSVSAFGKVLLEVGILFPILITLTGLFIIFISVLAMLLLFEKRNEICLGGIIGGVVAIGMTWLAWFIF